jgi:FHA domain
MSNSNTLKRGRICPNPQCKAIAEPDDLFCPAGCGHEFTDADPIVMLNADGTVHDESAPVTPANLGGNSQSHATPEPVVVTVPPLVPPQDPDPAGTTPSLQTDPAAAEPVCKICYIDVSLDTGPREGRPDDVTPPADPSGGCTLTGETMLFGRLCPGIPILGDDAVSRIHGAFVRRADGGYKLQCRSENFTQVNGAWLDKGKEIDLKDGDQIKVGDFYLIVYHED